MLSNSVTMVLIILIINIVYVSFFTIRMILTLKGQTIKELDPKAFIIVYEPKTIHGGFWVKSVRKGKLFHGRKNEV